MNFCCLIYKKTIFSKNVSKIYPQGRPFSPDGRLPDASKGSNHLRSIFYRMGFDDRAIVALSGAHAVGRCHTDRSGFDGAWTRSSTTFSNEYFRLLLEEKWTQRRWNGPAQFENKERDLMMLPTDVALTTDPQFRIWVERYAEDEELFFNDFAKYYQQLNELGCRNLKPISWCSWACSYVKSFTHQLYTAPVRVRKISEK